MKIALLLLMVFSVVGCMSAEDQLREATLNMGGTFIEADGTETRRSDAE